MDLSKKERFYLRLLLIHVKGTQCFTELHTYDKIVYSLAFEAAKARELVSSDEEWGKCFNEDTQNQFPHAVCIFFAYIFIFQNIINVRDFYDKYQIHFYHPSLSDEVDEIVALKNIEEILSINGYSLNDFNLLTIVEDEKGESYFTKLKFSQQSNTKKL